MSLLSRFKALFTGGAMPSTSAADPAIQARYDNAMLTKENERDWWNADYLSAKAANSYQVRRLLRMRSRYELSNNPYLWGVCNNNADDLVSTGPTLKCFGNDARAKQVEAQWNEWASEVDFTEKIRTCKLARTVDGEGFLILKNADLYNSVKLYPMDVEADQVTGIMPNNLFELWIDGLTLDDVGRVTSYTVLKNNPGDLFFNDFNPTKFDRISSKYVIHWFPKFRPGQVRGVPIFTPSLDLFTDLRAYRKAVLGAANLAADYAAVIESDAPAWVNPNGNNYAPFQRVRANREMMMFLPAGQTMKQFDAKQPMTSYEMFQEKCLGEACRPLSYPLNLALGTSQKFNFSSAKLDHINYRAALRVERSQCETYVLEPIFRAWFAEAVRIPKYLPEGVNSLADVPHEWHWPGFAALDEAVETDANSKALSSGQMTWREFWATRGYDWREVMKQQADERAEIEKLGLQFGDPTKTTISQQEESEATDPV